MNPRRGKSLGCPKPSLLNYESGHSRLATGFEKQPVKFEFRFFILAGSYAAFAAIDAEKSYFSIRPTPATRRLRKADIQMTAVPLETCRMDYANYSAIAAGYSSQAALLQSSTDQSFKLGYGLS